MLSGSTVPPDSRETEFGSSNQEVSPSAGKNAKVVLVPYHVWKCIPTAIPGGVDIFSAPWVSFVTTDELSVRATKITSSIVFS